MIAYQAYRAQTALKEDQAAKFRDLVPVVGIKLLRGKHQTLGHLALEELHGIAEELAYTCRR